MKTKPAVVLLFNSSDYAANPWIEAGHTVVSFDYDETDHSACRVSHSDASTAQHIRISRDLTVPITHHSDDTRAIRIVARGVKSALEGLGLHAAVVYSFSPCTNLAVSGAAHFKKKRALNKNFQREAVAMARIAEFMGCAWLVENPVSVLSTLWMKPSVVCDPCDFGGYLPEGDVHPEAPDLFPSRDAYKKRTCYWTGGGFVAPTTKPVECTDTVFVGHVKLGGKSARTKHLRSLTPRGVAIALMQANQHLIGE
jgi:hypothetical protein